MSMTLTHNDLEFVYILDDDPLMRRSTSKLLESFGYHVRAYATAEELLSRKPPANPSCLLLDVEMPDMNGLQIQNLIQEAGWLLPVVFMSGYGTVPISVKAIKNGALDFLVKPFEENTLIEAVENALNISRAQHQEKAVENTARSKVELLTDREKEVLSLVITGKLNKQIADILDISERTVKAHRARVMQKMGVASVAELIPLAEKGGVSASVA